MKKRCKVRNLSVGSYAQGFSAWIYICHTSEEFSDAVLIPDFFNDASGMLKTGDQLIISNRITGEGAIRFVLVEDETVSKIKPE